MKRLLIRPAAAADLEEAYRWYEAQREGLGQEFLSAADAGLKAIADNPLAYPVVHRDRRRAFLSRFPYGLLYRLVEEQVILLGVFHSKRNPRTLRTRR